jgi:hypothetical protein
VHGSMHGKFELLQHYGEDEKVSKVTRTSDADLDLVHSQIFLDSDNLNFGQLVPK